MGNFWSKLFGGSKSKDGTPSTQDASDADKDDHPIIASPIKCRRDPSPAKIASKKDRPPPFVGKSEPQIVSTPPASRVTIPNPVYKTTFETTINPSSDHFEKLVAPLATIEVDADILDRDVTPAPEDIENAVVKIQAGVRGYLTRKNLKSKSEASTPDVELPPPPPEFTNVAIGEEAFEGISTIQKSLDPDGKISRNASPTQIPNRELSEDMEILSEQPSPGIVTPQVQSVVMSFMTSTPADNMKHSIESFVNQMVADAQDSANEVMSKSIVSLEETDSPKNESEEKVASTEMLKNPHEVTTTFMSGLPEIRKPTIHLTSALHDKRKNISVLPNPHDVTHIYSGEIPSITSATTPSDVPEKIEERRKSLAEKLGEFALESISNVRDVLTQAITRSEPKVEESIKLPNPHDVTNVWVGTSIETPHKTWEEKRHQYQENQQLVTVVETPNLLDEVAAVKIQAAYRGYQVRKTMSRDVSPQPPMTPTQNIPDLEHLQEQKSLEQLDDDTDFTKKLEGRLELLDAAARAEQLPDLPLLRDSQDSITREALKKIQDEREAEEKRQKELDQLLDLLTETHPPEEFDAIFNDDDDMKSQADVFANDNFREVVKRTPEATDITSETLPEIPAQLLSDPSDPTDFVVPDPPSASSQSFLPDERNLSRSKKRNKKNKQNSLSRTESVSEDSNPSSSFDRSNEIGEELLTNVKMPVIPTIDIRKASAVPGDPDYPMLSAESLDSPETPTSPGDDEDDGEEKEEGRPEVFVRGTSPNPFGGRKKRRRNKGKSQQKPQ